MFKLRSLALVLIFFSLRLYSAEVRLSVTGPESKLVSSVIGEKLVPVKIEGDTKGITLAGELRGYGSDESVIRSESVKVEGEKGVLKFDIDDSGFYDLTVIATKNGKEIKRISSSYAVVPPNAYDHPKEMGTCTHFAQGTGAYPLTFDLLKLAGFTRIRDDLAWAHIEKKPGKYSIPERVEKAVDTALKYNIKPLLVTGYNNGSAYPGKFEKAFPTTPEMREAFAKAVAYSVKHFGNRVTEWEIWNEPNAADPIEDYLPLIQSVYPEAKKANSKATIISCGGGGAGGGPGGGMIVPIVNAGGIFFQDGFSIHPYMAPHEPDYGYGGNNSPISRVSIPVFTEYLKRFIDSREKSYGRKLSLWVTELGWPVGLSGTTPMMQAAYIARMYLLFRRADVAEGVFWYDFQDDGIDPTNKEHNFGLIRKDFSPKPSYQAAAVVASVLRNHPFVKAIKDGDIKIYVYGEGKDQVIAAWKSKLNGSFDDKEEAVSFQLPFQISKACLIDWQGRKRKLKSNGNNVVTLKVNAIPQYTIQNGIGVISRAGHAKKAAELTIGLSN